MFALEHPILPNIPRRPIASTRAPVLHLLVKQKLIFEFISVVNCRDTELTWCVRTTHGLTDAIAPG